MKATLSFAITFSTIVLVPSAAMALAGKQISGESIGVLVVIGLFIGMIAAASTE